MYRLLYSGVPFIDVPSYTAQYYLLINGIRESYKSLQRVLFLSANNSYFKYS